MAIFRSAGVHQWFIRGRLGDDGEQYVQTMQRRGYRFVARVTEVSDHDTDLIVEEHSRAHIAIEEDDYSDKVFETRATLQRSCPHPTDPVQ